MATWIANQSVTPGPSNQRVVPGATDDGVRACRVMTPGQYIVSARAACVHRLVAGAAGICQGSYAGVREREDAASTAKQCRPAAAASHRPVTGTANDRHKASPADKLEGARLAEHKLIVASSMDRARPGPCHNGVVRALVGNIK